MLRHLGAPSTTAGPRGRAGRQPVFPRDGAQEETPVSSTAAGGAGPSRADSPSPRPRSTVAAQGWRQPPHERRLGRGKVCIQPDEISLITRG